MNDSNVTTMYSLDAAAAADNDDVRRRSDITTGCRRSIFELTAGAPHATKCIVSR